MLEAQSLLTFTTGPADGLQQDTSTSSGDSRDTSSSSSSCNENNNCGGFAGYEDEYQTCLGFIRLGLSGKVDSALVKPVGTVQKQLFRPPKGLLLHGPPGTGKSRMMRSLVRAVGCRSVEVSHGILLSG